MDHIPVTNIKLQTAVATFVSIVNANIYSRHPHEKKVFTIDTKCVIEDPLSTLHGLIETVVKNTTLNDEEVVQMWVNHARYCDQGRISMFDPLMQLDDDKCW